jgi:type II secretory pathway component PulF
MRQLADRNLRRLVERIEWVKSLLVPLALVAAGVVVCGIVWSVFYPLVLLTGGQG